MPRKKVIKKVVKSKAKIVKPKVKPVEPVVEPKEEKPKGLKFESYLGVKILSISKREDGAYDVALADGTTTILDQRQYEINVI